MLIALLVAGALAAAALAPPAARERRPFASPASQASGIEPDGLLVLAVLSPERALVADPRTGASSERRLAGGTLCHGPVLAIGNRVVLSGSRGLHPIVRSLPLTLTGPGRSLGAAETFVASSAPGRLWLGRRRGTARVSLREVDAAGHAVARTTVRAPRWGVLQAVVDGGFVVSDEHGLSLRRAVSGPRSFRDAWLVAAGGARFAWCRPDGTGACRRIGIWSRDAERTLDPPAGARPYLGGHAAFSPDGRHLAMAVRASGRDRVAVVDLTRGAWRVIAGARLAGYRSTAWSPSGRWLYFTGSRHQVMGWRVGADRPIPLPIHTGGAVMSIATTPSGRSDLSTSK